MRIVVTALIAALTLAACSIKQVTSISMQDQKRVCIIENPRVKFDFLGAYRRSLEARGFQVEVWSETAQVDICPITSRYTGNYRWDLFVYLAYADLQVFRDGKPAGRAVYNARNSRPNAESKIKDLVDELYRN